MKKENEEPKDKDIKDEEHGIEMSDDFEGKLHEGKTEPSEEEENEESNEDLEKQMGDVESDDVEKLDEKVWGSDSENEEELNEDDSGGGVTENAPSELAAKDDRYKEAAEGDNNKGEQPQEVPLDTENEEYTGEQPDPMINAPPAEEPEVTELPEDMEITDDVDKDGSEAENAEEMNEPIDKLDDSKDEPAEEMNEMEEAGKDEEKGDKKQEEAEENEDVKGKDIASQNDVDEPMDESDTHKQDEVALPSDTPTAEVQALPSDEQKSSSDPVQSNEAMDCEAGAHNSEEQHEQGLSEAKDVPSEDPGHEGKKSAGKARQLTDQSLHPKLRPHGEKRTLDESTEEQSAKKRHIMDKKSDKPIDTSQDNGDAEIYEHVSKEEEGTTQAIDIATKEEADVRTVHGENQDDDDDDDDDEDEEENEVIELSSSDDESEEPCDKPVGESLKANQNKKPGERGDTVENSENVDIPEGEIVRTQTVPRGPGSSIHTQNEIWKSLSTRTAPPNRQKNLGNVNLAPVDGKSYTSDELWRTYEMQISDLTQQLCEQLRLVLEPTKMSKFKGDYRTGKRLNMRKIIPYIASQFRKDKIWLRRTKPSKRQYQIMLAVDDSSSMADNNSKQFACQCLAVLGQSLTLLEAGELSVVSFGEKIQLLHGFQDQFSSTAGARILEQFTFAQQKTKFAELLDFATDIMVHSRNNSRHTASKETAQLLIIVSDGRGIHSEGEDRVKKAVKCARDNNIFMVFLILDNPVNQHSILDIKSFREKDYKEAIPYMDLFPFPFYIILREISALPQILGEALRQWFELVTSVDR